MVGLGTIINVAGIIAGGILGSVCGKLIHENIREALPKACGVSTMFMGISGTLSEMFSADTVTGGISSNGSMLIIGCMVLGTLVGEIINIEGALERFGEWLKAKSGNSGDGGFVDAFLTTSFTVCIGAMAIMGSLQDGLFGDYSLLATKAVLDLIIVMILTGSLGKGCVFSAVPVAILQGGVTMLAGLISPLMTEAALSNLSMVGNILIFCVGLNLVWGKTVKVANMLPAIIFAVAAALIL